MGILLKLYAQLWIRNEVSKSMKERYEKFTELQNIVSSSSDINWNSCVLHLSFHETYILKI